MIHHFRGVAPRVEIDEDHISITLTNSVTGEEITLNGPRSALFMQPGREITSDEAEEFASHIAEAVNRWEGTSGGTSEMER